MQTFYCPKCGYNLTGLGAGACPECKRRFEVGEAEGAPARGRPAFIWGVLMVLAVPGAVFIALAGMGGPLMKWMERAGVEQVWVVIGVVGLPALATSLIAGRRLARRLARRFPGDPPTPTTVVMTLFFSGILFANQVVFCMGMVLLAMCATAFRF